jgi:hypothetical protein
VVCDEHGIGGSGEYCGDNDVHLDRISVLFRLYVGPELSRCVHKHF